MDEIVRLHGIPISIVFYRDPWFVSRFWQQLQGVLGTKLNFSTTTYHPQTDGQSERTIQILKDMPRTCILDFGGCWGQYMALVEFAYNNSYHSSIQMRLQTAQSRQKSYADNRRKDLEFEVGDKVFLKVTPLRSFTVGKGKKFQPRYVRPFKILQRVGNVVYRLKLPASLSRIHDVFHVSMLNVTAPPPPKKYHPDPTHVLKPEEINIDESLTYEERPVQILDRKVKELRIKRIPLVKILWRNHEVEEVTWEVEEEIRAKYPELFSDQVLSLDDERRQLVNTNRALLQEIEELSIMVNAQGDRITELEGTVVDEMARTETARDELQRARARLTRIGEEVRNRAAGILADTTMLIDEVMR
ncbi:uncharacterized protein [Coffea arabica]|uniref:Integrase catalytic domain-containing protein n=1 Tax=Coffea arabica TaxID=13443 RepID=A0ABM4VC10_COFAR